MGATVIVYPEFLHEGRISPLLYGNFVEFLGAQVASLWAEMLCDRALEGLAEVSDATRDYWISPVLEENPFYHSGYLERPWFPVGKHSGAHWTRDNNQAFRGRFCLRIDIDAPSHNQPRGIAQRGLSVEAGRTYRVELHLRGQSLQAPVVVTIGRDMGHLTDAYASYTFDEIGSIWKHFEVELTPAYSDSEADLIIKTTGPGTLWIDNLSLMPADAIDGWRSDVVELIRKVRPTIVRFPGGCYTSFTHWADAIGPREKRKPFINPYWGGLEPNDVGTDELLRLLEHIGAVPQICVNMITGTPEEAAAWVEYCNGAIDTEWGACRATNGHIEPYNVRYWEMGNEPYRRYKTAEEYARVLNEFSAAMRAVDPTIELMAAGYGPYRKHVDRIVKIAGGQIDFIALRANVAEEILTVAKQIERAIPPGRRIKIASTEWISRTPHLDARVPPKGRWEDMCWWETNKATWDYALQAALTLNDFQRVSHWIEIANFNNLANTWLQSCIEVEKSRAFLTAAGWVFHLYSYYCQGIYPLRVEHETQLDVMASLGCQKKRVYLMVVNDTEEQIHTSIQLEGFGTPIKTECWTVSGPAYEARNSFAHPHTIALQPVLVHLSKTELLHGFPPLSVTALILDAEPFQ